MPDGFDVAVTDDVIHVSGDLDAQTSPTLDQVIGEQLAAGRTEIVLDLSGLQFVDSSGLRSLVLARGSDGNGRVVLRSPSTPVLRLLDITGLTEVFVIEP